MTILQHFEDTQILLTRWCNLSRKRLIFRHRFLILRVSCLRDLPVVRAAPLSQYLENDDYSWTVTVHTIPKPTISAAAVPDTRDAESVHYLYVCKKGGTAEEGA